MDPVKRILVVDDDPHLRDVVVYALEREGFAVDAAADGEAGLRAFGAGPGYDLVVLDVLMPELDGLEVCRRLRARGRTPIVFLSSKDDELDRVLGLELGGDDYVTKPFSPRELVARVRAVLRRASPPPAEPAPAPPPLRVGPVELDEARHEVRCEGAPVRLTVTEFGVLASLMRKPGLVLTRAQLMEHAYAYDNLITERTMDSHVKRIRRKFRDAGFDPIETVYGLGYKFRA
ncbi:MAG TPA: response regulator transcription factor [Polyangiaceae bacterium]|nr:response regulator transcription factor [Polyangiaceae bacterium]